MSYMNCPSCGSQNRERDSECYNCSKPLHTESQSSPATKEPQSGEESVSAPTQVSEQQIFTGFVAVALSCILGAGLGFGLEVLPFELPFFLEELAIGAICATATAFSLGKFLEMPEGLLFQRLGPAAGLGALVGICLYGIWWSFDPAGGLGLVGGIAGVCSGIPVAVSFGLAGGESRPIGQLEYGNVMLSMALGLMIGIFLTFGSYSRGSLGTHYYREGMDWGYVPGAMGLLALIPTLLGGRINLSDLMKYLPETNNSRY